MGILPWVLDKLERVVQAAVEVGLIDFIRRYRSDAQKRYVQRKAGQNWILNQLP